MKYFLKFLTVLIAFSFAACEQEQDIQPDVLAENITVVDQELIQSLNLPEINTDEVENSQGKISACYAPNTTQLINCLNGFGANPPSGSCQEKNINLVAFPVNMLPYDYPMNSYEVAFTYIYIINFLNGFAFNCFKGQTAANANLQFTYDPGFLEEDFILIEGVYYCCN